MFKITISEELKKRFFTALFLFPLTIIVLIFSKILMTIFLIIFFILSVYEINKNCEGFFFKTIAIFLLLVSFFSFHYLRGNNEESLILLLWLLFSTFLSDIGGYVVGKTLKGRKLTKISPNKTYSGSVGSFIFSVLAMPIIQMVQIIFYKSLIINFFNFKFFLFTIIISLIAQIGDIFVSFWKRKFNVKDTSDLLPGHGGILDRIDGLIFVLIFMSLFKILGYL